MKQKNPVIKQVNLSELPNFLIRYTPTLPRKADTVNHWQK